MPSSPPLLVMDYVGLAKLVVAAVVFVLVMSRVKEPAVGP
jgi:hypothetical protein